MKHWLTVGAILGGLSVLLGAFGAHALKEVLSPERLVTFETAVRYQFYHALALLAVGQFAADNLWAARAGGLFAVGVALFSGSLYLLCATGITILGAITPFGGLSFMAGWVCLAVASRR
ncbi:MAG: DUF423 domain-containing protein [Vulcanimicrobiota bacterium]